MKTFLISLLSLIIFSCKDSHTELHKEMDKVSAEFRKFDEQLVTLYAESEKNPEKVILKIDSLLQVNKNETDKYKSQIKSNIESSLHYFRAELLYKIGKYKESIKELDFEDYRNGDAAIAYAANYVKLKNFETAKSFIDSIGNWNGNDFALGNYYESVGNKTDALKAYKLIEQDKSIKHYFFYKLAVERIKELKKNDSKFLNEIYFRTGNPSFEICDSDDENRTKIFDLMEKLPENQEWAGTEIIESPQENDKIYYWVRVETKENKKLNYYIYQKTFEIKFFDPKTNKLMTLAEWRK